MDNWLLSTSRKSRKIGRYCSSAKKYFISKHRYPQWSEDECLCCRNVTNEVHCFDNGIPGMQYIYVVIKIIVCAQLRHF